MPDKIDQLYDALKADKAVSKSRENFRSFMLAPGTEGYQNRLKLFKALKADGAVQSKTYEEFRSKLVKPSVRKQQASAIIGGASGSSVPEGWGELDTSTAGIAPVMRDKQPQSSEEEQKAKQMVAQTNRALRGDKSAASKTGLTSANQRMKDEMDYSMATGKELRLGMNLPGVAPTVARDEQGNILNGEGGEPLVGTTTDEQRVAQYHQQERERSRKEMVNELVDRLQKDMDNKAFDEYKKSHKDWKGNILSHGLNSDSFSSLAAYNQASSPEQLLRLLNENYGYESPEEKERKSEELRKQGKSAVLANWDEKEKKGSFINRFVEENKDKIEDAALRSNMSVEDYVWNELVPNLSNDIAERFGQNMSEKYSVKGTADYLMREMSNSLIGTLASMSVNTKQQRQYMQEELQKSREGKGAHYNASFGSRLAGETLMFAADAAPMMVGGAIGGYTAKGVGSALKALGATELGTLVSTGSSFLAANVGTATKYLGYGIKGALGMAPFMGASSAVQDMSVGDGTLSSIGRSFLEGAWEGAKFGLATSTFGLASGSLGKNISSVKGKLSYGAGAFLVENQIFSGLDYIKDPENFNWRESSMDAMYMQLASKLSSPANLKETAARFVSMFKPGVSSQPIQLNDTDKEYIQKAFGGMDFTNIAGDVNNIGKILSDKVNIPWVTRQKVEGYTTNTFESRRPRTNNIEESGNRLLERAADGELIEVHDFKDEQERDAIRQDIYDRRANDDMMADYAVLLQKRNAVPTQEQIDNARKEIFSDMQKRDSKYDASNLEEGGADYQAVVDRANEKNNQATILIETLANDYGKTTQEVYEAMRKKTVERDFEEQNMIDDLQKRLHDAAFPKGEYHPSQSAIDAKKMVGDGPVIDPQVSAELSRRVDTATNEYNQFMQSHQDILEGVTKLGNVRPDEVLMFIADNYSGSERDEGMRVVSNYYNALAAKEAAMEKVADNIENYVTTEIDRNGFKGNIDDVPDTENIITVTDGKTNPKTGQPRRLTLLNGDVGTIEDASSGRRVLDSEKSGGQIICRDEDGQFVILKPDAKISLLEQMPKEDYANNLREELGIQNTQTIIETGLEKVPEPQQETQQGAQPAVEAGREQTGANETAGAPNVGRYGVNTERVGSATVDDYGKLSPITEAGRKYYSENPVVMRQDIAKRAEVASRYLNGELSDKEYLAERGYERQWIDSQAPDALKSFVLEDVDKVREFLSDNGERKNEPVSPEQSQQPAEAAEAQPAEPAPAGEPAGTEAMEIPTDKDGVKRYEQSGVDVDAAIKDLRKDQIDPTQMADAMISEAEETIKKIGKKKNPKPADIVKDTKARLDAQQVIDYWTQLRNRVAQQRADELARESAEREEQRRKAAEEAALQARQKQEEELSADERFKANRERYQASREYGNEDTIVLPNGEVVEGRWVLHDAFAVTPSHDPFRNFEMSEGYPVDENGKTINDRDYKNDKNAQQITIKTSKIWDQRGGLQGDPVITTDDGIIMSGNGRTQEGQLAARNSTEGKYIDYAIKNTHKWGFTPEQIRARIERGEFPRISFELKNKPPYTAEEFAKFNQNEKKSQSKLETSVKMGKVLATKPQTLGRIGSIIDQVENLSDLYSDVEKTKDVLLAMKEGGLITDEGIARLTDENGLLSAQGKDEFETMLAGVVVDEDALRILNNPANSLGDLRKSIAYAVVPLVKNQTLGDYSIIKDVSEAVRLYDRARKAGLVGKDGDITNYFINKDAFDGAPMDNHSLAQLLLANQMSKGGYHLKRIIDAYNAEAQNAAAGQVDMWSGGVRSKEDIISDILKQQGYDAESIRQRVERLRETQPPVERDSEGREGGTDRADDSKGEGRTEPERKPEPEQRVEGKEEGEADAKPQSAEKEGGNEIIEEKTEQDEYLKPRNEKEKEIVKDVLEQLQQEIDAAVKERDKAASALEKARAEESDKATDMFSDDNAFKEEGQLFDSSDMPTDRSQEGVNKRTSAERERLLDAQEKLNKLQSEAERNSRIRGALDNERRQTKIPLGEPEGTGVKRNFVPSEKTKELDKKAQVETDKQFELEQQRDKLIEERDKLEASLKGKRGAKREEIENQLKEVRKQLNEFNKQIAEQDDITNDAVEEWRDSERKDMIEQFDKMTDEEILRLAKEKENAAENDDALYGDPEYEALIDIMQARDLEAPKYSDNPVEAIEKAATEFKKEQDKEIGITHDETPEQKADRENEAKLADTPITADEIDGADISDVEKTLAKAYLNGNQGFLQKAAYLKAYDNVRNRRQDGTGDSLDAEGRAQLDSRENKPESRPGRTGEPTVPVDETKGGVTDEGQRRLEDGEGQPDTPAGKRGDRSVSGAEPAVDGLPAGSEQPAGGRESGSTRPDVRGAESDKGSRKDTPKPAAGSDAAIAASKQRLAELRQRFKKAGRNGTTSVSLAGMNAEQIEILMDITTEAANLGYQYLVKGAREFKEWNKQMLEDFHDWLKEDMKWSDAEIDEYLNEVWNCEYNIDGVTRSIREWASLMGEKELRKVVKADRGSKFEAQKAAESIEVKTGDIDNIRETLPFLLPEQQDDVLKAETQFFDEKHQDREHGNGKGMMFTNGTGTGKTYTGLGIVKRFVKQGKGRVLILTPSQEKVTDWSNDGLNLGLNVEKLDDIAKAKGTTATKSKGTGVVVTTYANARQNLALLEDCFDLIVYDESHKITEGKEAAEGEMYKFHQMLTNKNVEKSIDRQTYWLPEWVEYRNLVKEREENRKMLDNLDNYDNEETVKVDGNEINVGELRSRLNARMLEIENRFGELQPIMQEIRESKRGQAEIDSKRTKTVFLSATPFNTRENMKYAEGYLFSYPEEDPNTKGSYNHRSPEDAFLERYFPAGYRWRYGRLESHVENAEALGRQEIDFSDYLQNQLGTLSGRMISSDYDYSRDFPIMTLDHAGRFNQAMSDVYRNKRYNAMAEAFQKSFDYNYSTALFEAMKTSLVIDRIKEHLKRGQKVVVFHRRRTSGDLEPPFERALNYARIMAETEGQNGNQKGKQKILDAVKAFSEDFADMLEWEKGLDYTLPRDQIAKVFGEDKVGFFSGAENKKTKHGSVEDFMKDNGGKDIIVIQEASGKEGISLHDQTGEHQRVEINLALPQSPIAFIQIEGRIYRIGQKSNAIFEYPLLGLDLETSLFAQKFNSALGTTENLALGSKARNLRKSIANSILLNTGEVDYDRQGLGGKDMDGQVASRTKDSFDEAISDYYGNQKMQRGRGNREGYDYFPTPEPVGFKMVEWGQLMEGESALEPSAGHGAIARYVPETNPLTAIEPSADLFSKLQMRAGGPGRRFEDRTFENYPLANKHDVIVMNPPYGVQGKMAMEHVAKAFKHLNEGGRLIAIIPDGPAMERRFDAWLDSTGADGTNGANVLVGEVKLPDVAFGRAGTNVRTRIVVIDKVTRAQMRDGMPDRVEMDLSGAKTVEDMFEQLRHVNMPERTIDQAAIAQKQAMKTKKSFEDNKFVREVVVDEKGVNISNRSSYGSVPSLRINFDQIDNPRQRENLLVQVDGLISARDNVEMLDYGRWKNKTYGSGKNAVPAVEAIRDYCDTAIKTIANVLKTTPDGLEKEVKAMKEEAERQRQERMTELQNLRDEQERRHQEKVNFIVETALKENPDNETLTTDGIRRNMEIAHGRDYLEAAKAKRTLRDAGIDWQTGHKIPNKQKNIEKAYREEMPLGLDTMKHLMAIAEDSIDANRKMAAKRALEMSGIHSDTGDAKEGFDYSSHDEYYEKELRGFLEKASPIKHLKTKIQEREEGKPSSTVAPKPAGRKESYEYKLDQNTKTGADMHLVVMNERVDDATYKDLQRKAKALNDGYYNRFKKAWHFKTEEDARKFMEQVNVSNGNDGRPTTRFRLREKEAPKKTQKVYKLMRLGDDGKLYPLFIDAAAPTELGKWYDADSPNMSILKEMPAGTFLVDYANGTYKSLEEVAKESQQKVGKNPSAVMINEATKNGQRWVRITDTGRGQRRYGGETRKYMNLGINGSGQVGEFAMRPGWHAGSLPSMRQIGKGKDRNLRDDKFVWVEGEVPADREWQSVAEKNPDKDIPTEIPEDGYYLKATNANKAASQADRIGWYVAGAFKANRIMSDVEARNVITRWNEEHPDQKVDYDWERESGKDFNAETMQLEDRPKTLFSRRTRSKKTTPETNVVPEDKSSFKATGFSSVDGAKIRKNLDSFAKESEKITIKKKNTFISDLAKEIGAVSKGSNSKYAKFETKNGNEVLVRLSDHNATVSNFDYSGETNGISIVVSRKPNEGITNDGNAHIAEFFYSDSELKGADGNPYSEIVKSLHQALYSGEYKDNTGLARKEEVNGTIEDVETRMRSMDSESTPVNPAYERNRKAGERLAKKLNADFEAITDKSQIKNQDVLDAMARGEEPTGWIEIDKKTGKHKIYMYMPNIRDTYEAEKTIAHEVVGHHGLRELLGEEGYRSYMRTLWLDMKDESLSKYIKENYSRHGDIYTTIDEYLAEAAEKGYGKLPMWQKVRDVMTDALRKAGFEMTPSISDVKYMVWLSKNQLRQGEPMSEMKRQSLLYRLGKEKYDAKVKDGEFVFEDSSSESSQAVPNVPFFPGNRTYFRSTPSAKTAKMQYERALNRLGYAWKESHIDQMQAGVELMRAISGVKKIEDIPSVENFVLAENQMSSKEEQMDYLFHRDYMNPLSDAVASVLPEFGSKTDDALRELQIYMIKKSGLERNRCLYVRDKIREYRKDDSMDQNAVQQLEDDWNQLLDDIRDDIRNGQIDLREYLENMDAFIKQNIDPNFKAGDHDYSGLTAMTGSKKGYDDVAVIDDVMNTESMVGDERIKNLWEKTKAVSQYGLDMEYEGGLDSKEKHDKVSRMFEWYVPMRGYDETLADDVYDYLEENKGTDYAGPVLMNAKGRESLSNVDLFAQLGAMSSNAVHRALKNEVKQVFARFIRNHYGKDGADRLVTELKYLWGEKRYDPVTGKEYYEEVFPDIPENATADEIAKIVEDFESDMKAKEGTGDAKRMRQNSSIPFRPSQKNKPQHIVEAYINGEKKTFIVNGNPRAAQAINGQLKSETNHRVITRITRMMAQLNTSYNPDFVVGNTERDWIFSSAAILAKESPKYFAQWQKNYFGRGIGRGVVGVPAMHTNLFKRYREGNLDMNNPTDRYFKEFMENGGETGWVEQKNLDKWRKEIVKGVKAQGTAEKAGRFIINAIPEAIEAMNERAENAARFATYMTSRQMGRSITRSVSDAKEVSVNFNRKGAGLKTKGIYKNDGSLKRINAVVAARTAQYGQDYLMFYNAGVQGLNNASKILRDHPIKASTIFAGFALGAFLMSNLNQALIDDEDPNERGGIQNPYAELPEWIRRNRLCLYAGKGEFITVDLPIELRALYGIGDIAAAYTTHPELKSEKPVWQDVMTQMTQVLPVDFMGEHPGEPWMSVVPSFAMPFAEVAMNQNWYGRKIEKDQYVDENDPRWKRAYKNANKAYIDASKGLNAGTNRYSNEDLKKMGIKDADINKVDPEFKGSADGKITDPAIVEHIVNGYFGGAGQTAGRLADIMKGALQGENFGELAKSPQMPILRRLHYSPTEQNKMARTRSKWWHYKEEMDNVMNDVKVFKEHGVSDPLAKMKQISTEDSVRATRASLMKSAQKQYTKMKKIYDKTENEEMRKDIEMRMDQLMENTVNGLDAIK